uniref:Uncharacterized protein n=1 Tax=Magallana gigas TaxID=29159 RepID=A0A8W8ITS7_MAGGI
MFILFQFSFIAFSNIVYKCTSTEQTGVCSNGSDGSRLECCENYRPVGNSCEECWPGTHGVNCRDNCPPNFFGRLCSKKCGCEPYDKVIGCLNATDRDQNTSINKSSPKEDESPTNSATWLTFKVGIDCPENVLHNPIEDSAELRCSRNSFDNITACLNRTGQ